jgi:predicted ATP-binding protein involved in virulence
MSNVNIETEENTLVISTISTESIRVLSHFSDTEKPLIRCFDFIDESNDNYVLGYN